MEANELHFRNFNDSLWERRGVEMDIVSLETIFWISVGPKVLRYEQGKTFTWRFFVGSKCIKIYENVSHSIHKDLFLLYKSLVYNS